MKSERSNNTLSPVVLPSLACLAWQSFENHGLTKKRARYQTWEDSISDSVSEMEKLIGDSLSCNIGVKNGNEQSKNEEGATWLGQKSN